MSACGARLGRTNNSHSQVLQNSGYAWNIRVPSFVSKTLKPLKEKGSRKSHLLGSSWEVHGGVV